MAFIYDLTDTWNAGGTTFSAIKMNVTDTASAAASKLVTLQVGGTEKFSVQKDGFTDVNGNVRLSAASPAIELNLGGPQLYVPAANTFALATGGGIGSPVERLRVDASGNVGIGRVPSAWAAGNFVGLQVGLGASIAGRAGAGTEDQIYVSSNAYNDGAWKYIGTGAAANYYQDNGEHVWRTAGSGTAGNAISFSERMRIDNSGNVGIGTSNPTSIAGYTTLEINHGTNGAILDLAQADTMRGRLVGTAGSFAIETNTGIPITFSPAGVQQMLLSTSGNVGIGTSSPGAKLHVVGNTFVQSGTIFTDAITSYGGTSLSLNGGSNLISITGGSERMRIDSNGKLLVGTTSATAASVTGLVQAQSEIVSKGSLAGFFWEDRAGGVTSTANWYGWYTSSGTVYLYNGSSNIASINGSTGAYTALSDANLKRDFEPSDIGLNEIMALKPTLYRMKNDDDKAPKQLGFLAQEVRDHIPQACVETDDFIGLNDRPIIAALVKAVQELTTRVAELETSASTTTFEG